VGSVLVVGGTSSLGPEVVRHYAEQGRDVVLAGRDGAGAAKIAADFGASVRGIGLDLAEPTGVADALADVGPVDRLVLSAIKRDANNVAAYHSPFWISQPDVLETIRAGTLAGRLPTMSDVVDAAAFLLENPAVNGVDLVVDGGWR
jgi:NAD(P)-dependent dehydrogenase (short-subunit alcohol dehydrogenase family)